MQTFATTAPVTAHLDIPAGTVRLIAADRTDTTVEIRPANPARSRDTKAAEQITVEHTDNTLRISTAPAKNRLLGNSGAVEITVQLPAGSHLHAKLAAGELRGVGRLGHVTLDAAQARIKLDETADAHLTLNDGDITLGRTTGPARLTTQKGDLTIEEAVRGTLELHTQAGTITVTAARNTSATLDAGTSHGRITNTLTHTQGPDADLTIHATTSYGDITARSN
ncbi:DUF4097 family beta strand repeat-containing protein [Streptomyces sp. NPDC004111]|uniref:DUF4097 family beta strand repeat-containing protein n=1 Tax=Streptomyces sp. NPDC004111 TaxID=3364690 RepID=UPI0036A30AA5